MGQSCRILILSLTSTLAFSGVALGEKGVLVLHVSNLQGRPLPGVVLATMGDGSSSSPTTRDGKTRIRLAPQTEPGDIVTLQVTQNELRKKALVFISPWDAQVTVPSFENRSNYFARIRLASWGERALLEKPEAAKAMAQTLVKLLFPSTMAEIDRKEALTKTAQIFGLDPLKMDKAIHAWLQTTQDPYDQGLKALIDGDYTRSSPLLEESLKRRKEKLEEARKEIVEAANLLGQSRLGEGEYGKAAEAFRSALAQQPDDLGLLNRLGLALSQAGDYPGARDRFQKVLTLASAASGAEPPEALYARMNLAHTLYDQGELTEARGLGEQVLPEMQQVFGEKSRETLSAMNMMATILQEQGDLVGARKRWERLVVLSREVLSKRDQEIIKINLAGNLFDQGDLEGARKLQQEVLDAWKKELGADHPDTLTAQSNLAVTLSAMGKLREARALSAEVLEKLTKRLGKEHSNTLAAMTTLAAILRKQGDLAGALALFQEDLSICKTVLGEAHPDTLAVQGSLARVLRDQGDLGGARIHQENVLNARRAVLGEEHPNTLVAKDDLAVTLRLQGELPRARKLGDKAFADFRKVLGETAPATLTAMDHLALTLRAQGDLEGARKLLDSVVEMRRRNLGPRHLDTSEAEWELASTLRELGQAEAASPYLASLRWLLEADPEDLSRQQREIASQLPALLKK